MRTSPRPIISYASISLLPSEKTAHSGPGIRAGAMIVVTEPGRDLSGADHSRVAQFYIVESGRHFGDRVRTAIAIQIHAPQGQARHVTVPSGQNRAHRVHAAVVVHRITDRTTSIRIALRIDAVAIGAAEFRSLAREIARG